MIEIKKKGKDSKDNAHDVVVKLNVPTLTSFTKIDLVLKVMLNAPMKPVEGK